MLNVNPTRDDMPLNNLAKWIYEQRYLHRTIREILAKVIAPGFRNGHTFTTDFFGMKWLGKTNNYLDYQVLVRGSYEKFMLFFMRDVLLSSKGDKIVMDVGANVGNHALYISKFASTVHAFEPYDPARVSLEEKIGLNKIKNIITHPFGLSDRKETIPFYPQDSEGIGTGSFEKGFYETDAEKAIILRVDVGDDVVEDKCIQNIALVKIDVEGFERQVLEGLHQTHEKNRPVVIFESSPATRNSLATFEGMKSLFPDNYSFYVFSVKNKKNGAYKLAKITSISSLTNNDVIAVPDEKSSDLQHISQI